jgi:5,10-methylenetetrahydromethanopterin reductase
MPIGGFAWSITFTYGTVLEDGEDPGAARSLAAAGHGAAVMLHAGAERDLLGTLLPEQGRKWLAAYDAVPAESRHLAMHSGHLVLVNEHDRPYITGELLTKFGLARSAAGWQERLAQLEAAGATEVAYLPAGPDIAHELEAFINAARG